MLLEANEHFKKDHVTNEEVHRKIQAAIGEYDGTLDPGQETEAKMVWPCFKIFWSSKDTPIGHSERKRGGQKKRWEDNIKKWTGIDSASSTRAAENRTRWRGIVANSSMVPR